MKNKLLLFAVGACIATVFVSWILSAFGLTVNSLLSDEGLRWFLEHGGDGIQSRTISLIVLAAMATGMWQNNKRYWAILAVVWLLIVGFAHLPSSPLRGVTGTLYPSPFINSLPVLVCLSVIVVGALLDTKNIAERLTSGLQRWAYWIIIFLVLAFLKNEITYVACP